MGDYGLHAKAAKIKQLQGERRVATLVATVRELESSSVDDAWGCTAAGSPILAALARAAEADGRAQARHRAHQGLAGW
ncbi:hypothetical protein AB0J35_23695 [Nonomuraea angiospora]|uniref:hypothetical protein n=1 Tax=Nonomuraea angiospora TaxID=46172 RepID=UPI00344601D1